jgi:hypothetical protein
VLSTSDERDREKMDGQFAFVIGLVTEAAQGDASQKLGVIASVAVWLTCAMALYRIGAGLVRGNQWHGKSQPGYNRQHGSSSKAERLDTRALVTMSPESVWKGVGRCPRQCAIKLRVDCGRIRRTPPMLRYCGLRVGSGFHTYLKLQSSKTTGHALQRGGAKKGA